MIPASGNNSNYYKFSPSYLLLLDLVVFVTSVGYTYTPPHWTAVSQIRLNNTCINLLNSFQREMFLYLLKHAYIFGNFFGYEQYMLFPVKMLINLQPQILCICY